MLFELGISSLFLILAFAAVTLFFCEVEAAPTVARNLAKAVRFGRESGKERRIKYM